jgi:hypothetical protein
VSSNDDATGFGRARSGRNDHFKIRELVAGHFKGVVDGCQLRALELAADEAQRLLERVRTTEMTFPDVSRQMANGGFQAGRERL